MVRNSFDRTDHPVVFGYAVDIATVYLPVFNRTLVDEFCLGITLLNQSSKCQAINLLYDILVCRQLVRKFARSAHLLLRNRLGLLFLFTD